MTDTWEQRMSDRAKVRMAAEAAWRRQKAHDEWVEVVIGPHKTHHLHRTQHAGDICCADCKRSLTGVPCFVPTLDPVKVCVGCGEEGVSLYTIDQGWRNNENDR